MTAAVSVPALLLNAAASGTPESSARHSDLEAIGACQRGERQAFDTLVERYQRDVYRLCYRYVDNHHDANDMAQEVFLKAWKAIGRFRGDSAFSTWLYRIAVNTCLNFRAARKPQALELTDELPTAAVRADEALARAERSRRVREAVTRLPEKQRATMILKIYHDLSHEEVAQILGTTVGTVKANLFHAMANLRKLVGPIEESE